MNSREVPSTSHDEIARLAHLNWEKDDRPHGQDQKYWFEAELQIKATRHLLVSELSPPLNQPSGAPKTKLNGKVKKSRRLRRARSV